MNHIYILYSFQWSILGGATLLSHTHICGGCLPFFVCLHSLILWHKAYTNRFECFQFHQLISLLSGFASIPKYHRKNTTWMDFTGCLLVQKVHSPTKKNRARVQQNAPQSRKMGCGWQTSYPNQNDLSIWKKIELIGISETLTWWFYWFVCHHKQTCVLLRWLLPGKLEHHKSVIFNDFHLPPIHHWNITYHGKC